MIKKLVFLAMTTLSLAVFAGCAATVDSKNEGKEAEAGVEQTAPKTQLEDVLKTGILKIGTEGTYAPFTFHDSTGKLTGFDVEIAEEVAKRIGVKAEFVETKWDGMFAGLDSNRFDIAVNQIGIRADRQEKYDFSIPYIQSRAVLVVKEGNQSIKTFEDLKGKKTGQSLTSNFADIAKKNGAELVAVDSFNQALDLLASGRIDATINDSLSFLDFKKQKPDAKVVVAAKTDQADQSGILFRKGNETLVEAVNKALNDMIGDGTYSAISQKWFGEDVLK